MKIDKNNQGFTLIELLLVVGIVAIILSVIVPMGLRANVDAKYGVVRQNCSELASFASQWAEKSIMAQDEQLSTATLKDYYASLANEPDATGMNGAEGQWIAHQGDDTMWNLGLATGNPDTDRRTFPITGRYMDTIADAPPEDCIEEIVPPDKVIRNPFNQVNVFRLSNDPNDATNQGVVNGAIAFGGREETPEAGDQNPWIYFAFAFQGTDSKTFDLPDSTGDTYHGGMGLNEIAKLRNGIFAGRFR
ncbi:MAG: hypothetical protein SRB2_02561 [Desulfobacteraceae bacterium Eth-SRB2]|nr:MAG: hypothetical protein SRB2_02561 [Desulfobacteraceae bacterium Eth-SRB2]